MPSFFGPYEQVVVSLVVGEVRVHHFFGSLEVQAKAGLVKMTIEATVKEQRLNFEARV